MMKILFKQSGFTMVELLSAMIFAAILMAVAIPQLITALKKGKLQSYAQDLASNINLSRAQAMSKGRRAIVAIVKTGQAAIDFDGNGDAEHYFIFLDDATVNGNYDAGETVLAYEKWKDVQVAQNSFNACSGIPNANCMAITSLGIVPEGAFPAGGGDMELRLKFSDLSDESCLTVLSIVGLAEAGEVIGGNCVSK